MNVKIDLIVVNLLILFILTIISIVSGNNFFTNALTESYEYHHILDGTTSTLEMDNISADFALDPIIQAVIWISVIGGIGAISSFSILGSGLGSSGSRWLVGLIFFISIWVMLSTLPFNMIMDGGFIMTIIYLFMTMTYAIGCIWFLMDGGN